MTAFTPERMNSYCEAEDLCPDARTAELASFQKFLHDGAGKVVLELGSGNGPLTKCLTDMGWTVDTVDIAFQAPPGARRHYNADIANGLGFLPKDAAYDAVASLAVLHHVASDPKRLPTHLADDMAAVTKPGAMVILQDVPGDAALPQMPNSPDGAAGATGADGVYGAATTTRIFAELVDPHSTPTHNGIYLQMPAISSQLTQSTGPEFEPVACFHHACDWRFPNRDTAIQYVQSLFNLDLDRNRIEAVIEPVLKTVGAQGGQIHLPWALDCLVLRRT